MQALDLGGKLDVIFLVKLLFRVTLEIRVLGDGEIRGIEENKIARTRVLP
jgi:hypothetical protein